eukprot:8095990-Karenia_brevis.AAC.1
MPPLGTCWWLDDVAQVCFAWATRSAGSGTLPGPRMLATHPWGAIPPVVSGILHFGTPLACLQLLSEC